MKLAVMGWSALALLIGSTAMQPAGAAPIQAPPASRDLNLATPVACWWRQGARVCNGYRNRRHAYSRYSGRYYGYGPSRNYGAPSPESLRFGSTEWWRAMDREGRGGYRR